jgi:acetyl-CoA carboxylase biotin carboxylase subunit
MTGAAIECRINAEDPAFDFRPCPGTIAALHVPGGPGVRIDSAAYQGYVIPPFYDSMIAKLIVHAPTRREAIMKMRRSLAEFIVDGVKTNIDFELSLIADPVFESGQYDIAYLSKKS